VVATHASYRFNEATGIIVVTSVTHRMPR
jgi:hypothetical protein